MIKRNPVPASHPIYRAWSHMKGRCDNPKDSRYKTYGARGITYDPRWKDFLPFYADMAPTWVEGLTLERNNVNEGYSKKNCCWATPLQQARNRTTNKITQAQAEEIRRRFKPGLAYQKQLAVEFGISDRMVRYIGKEEWRC